MSEIQLKTKVQNPRKSKPKHRGIIYVKLAPVPANFKPCDALWRVDNNTIIIKHCKILAITTERWKLQTKFCLGIDWITVPPCQTRWHLKHINNVLSQVAHHKCFSCCVTYRPITDSTFQDSIVDVVNLYRKHWIVLKWFHKLTNQRTGKYFTFTWRCYRVYLRCTKLGIT